MFKKTTLSTPNCHIILIFATIMSIRNSISILILFLLCCIMPMQGKDFIVVIDAGHGGKDIGAPGIKSYEKNINLAVAKKVRDMLGNEMGIKVVLTRDKDIFLSLQDRCDIGNKANGDLFISIHVNSLAKKAKNRKTIRGASTYTLGLHKTDENLEVAMRENSVIELEEDYSAKYMGFDPNSSESYIIFEMSQSKHMEQSISFASLVQKEIVSLANRYNKGVRQAGFWVLAHTSMPAVLIELDFICNPESERFLVSESGQRKMAKSIYNAILSYKSKISTGKADDTKTPATATVEESTAEPEESVEETVGQEYYKIFLLSSDTKLPVRSKKFKGLKPLECTFSDGKYIYTYGKTTSLKEANKTLKTVKKKFKKAYIIKTKE